MPVRYLFGPVTPAFPGPSGPAGDCRTFGTGGAALDVPFDSDWSAIEGRFPRGWSPELAVLVLPSRVPAVLWSAPLPVVGLCLDPAWGFGPMSRVLRWCDLALSPPWAVEPLRRAGAGWVEAVDLFPHGVAEEVDPAGKDVDVLVVGEGHPGLERDGCPWLSALAGLGDRYRVELRLRCPEEERRSLLRRARVAVDLPLPGKRSAVPAEAAWAGALLFVPEGRSPRSHPFRAATECVEFAPDRLAASLEGWLADEPARLAVVGAARARARGTAFGANWPAVEARLAGWLPELTSRSRRRNVGLVERLVGRVEMDLIEPEGGDPTLPAEIDAALESHPRSAEVHRARGLLAGRQDVGPIRAAKAEAALPWFREAIRSEPGHAAARMDLVEAWVALGQSEPAVGEARALLELLDSTAMDQLGGLEGFRFPCVWDLFQVEANRLAWEACEPTRGAGDRVALMRWRLHSLLGELTGELAHWYEAALSRPDLPQARGSLGRALRRAGRESLAGTHLGIEFRSGLPSAAVRGKSPPPAPRRKRARVSLCMIVRDEASNLRDCLRGVEGLFFEVVVVDTGSTDGTREIAASLGARVFDFPWRDDFAAARNASIEHARGEWIFWLDADDRIDRDVKDKLVILLEELEGEAAYAMRCRCTPGPDQHAATVVDHVRLFRNDPRLRWTYRVHEQILPALRRLGHEVRRTDLVIRHVGYEDADLRKTKLRRDLRLLEMEHSERPGEPYVLFNLGATYRAVGRHEEALAMLRESLDRSRPGDSIVRKLYSLTADCHRALGRPAAALAVCRAGRALYPDDQELLLLEGELLAATGRKREAASRWESLLRGTEEPHFGSAEEGLRGFQARHRLASLCLAEGRGEEAKGHWQEALRERPDHLPSLLGMADLALDAGDPEALGRLADALAALPGGEPEADVLRARLSMRRGDFPAARSILEGACRRFPGELRPLVILSHALLQGGETEAAAAALREILRRDPDHAEALHNLNLLASRAGVGRKDER